MLGRAVASHHLMIGVAAKARTVGHGHDAFSRRDKLAAEASLEIDIEALHQHLLWGRGKDMQGREQAGPEIG